MKNWIALVLALLFAAFALVQLNDPDPWRWVFLYGAIAILGLLAAFGHHFLPLIHFMLVICIMWTISLLPEFINWLQSGAESIVQSMKAEKPHIELTREFLGLILSILALWYLLKKARISLT